ncbi:hypothetical protein QJS66_14905 [Kocuria rhizophila]|nr:hypothetical protein QJS66_14905 [Kocuria rhizophila]
MTCAARPHGPVPGSRPAPPGTTMPRLPPTRARRVNRWTPPRRSGSDRDHPRARRAAAGRGGRRGVLRCRDAPVSAWTSRPSSCCSPRRTGKATPPSRRVADPNVSTSVVAPAHGRGYGAAGRTGSSYEIRDTRIDGTTPPVNATVTQDGATTPVDVPDGRLNGLFKSCAWT